jgi:CheY-like chemotaxis protein
MEMMIRGWRGLTSGCAGHRRESGPLRHIERLGDAETGTNGKLARTENWQKQKTGVCYLRPLASGRYWMGKSNWRFASKYQWGDVVEPVTLDATRILLAAPGVPGEHETAEARPSRSDGSDATQAPLTALAQMLRDMNYDVVLLPSAGYEVFRYVKTRQPSHCDPVDLILVDISDGPEEGLKLVESIRRTDWSLPVIAICPEKPTSLFDELMRLGVMSFSPVAGADELRAAIVGTIPPYASAAAA